MSEPTASTAEPTASLRETVHRVASTIETPLAFARIKTMLKLAGIPVSGKKKVSDDDIRHELEAEVQAGRLYPYPGNKYSRVAPPLPLTEQILGLLGPEDRKNDKELKAGLHGSSKAPDFKKALAELTESGKLFVHGKGKTLAYAKYPPPPPPLPLTEQILGLLGPEDRKSDKDLKKGLHGSSKPADLKKALAELTEEGKLFTHGKGKTLTYAKNPPPAPPPPLQWFETKKHAKPFQSLLSSVNKLIDEGIVSFEDLFTLLRDKLSTNETKSDELPEPTPEVAQPTTRPDLRTTLRDAYEHLCLFVEFQDRLVELRRLYREAHKRDPHLTVSEFHAELEALSREWLIELHDLNEVQDAKERHLAIERDDRLFYFIRWK